MSFCSKARVQMVIEVAEWLSRLIKSTTRVLSKLEVFAIAGLRTSLSQLRFNFTLQNYM